MEHQWGLGCLTPSRGRGMHDRASNLGMYVRRQLYTLAVQVEQRPTEPLDRS